MNCFHFSVSLGYKTTIREFHPLLRLLWIALATPNRLAFPLLDFIFQYLWDTKQLRNLKLRESSSCELLSFFSIFGIQNNFGQNHHTIEAVVNCFGYAESPCFPFARFHFSVSLGYKTTALAFFMSYLELWIAFIFQYLWDTKQLLLILMCRILCCELLSFFSIFGIQNNVGFELVKVWNVVNCFHFSVSLGYKTTTFMNIKSGGMLWIAFIFQYLWDTKQQELKRIRSSTCCELLSFFSIFGIQNNILKVMAETLAVVNCFHFSVSLGYKTTSK